MKLLRCASVVAFLAFASGGCERTKVRASGDSAPVAKFPANASADSLLDAGEAVYKRSEFDSAITLLDAGRARGLLSGDSAAVARADTWLGLAAYRMGRYEDARRIGEAALAMKLRLGLAEDLFRSYNALGLLAHQQGRYSDASDLFGKARSSAEAVHDSVSIAKAIGNLGLVHSDIGQFDLARAEFTTLAEAGRKAGDTIPEANAMSNLGMLAVRSGDAATALDWLSRARVLYSAVGYPGGEESVLGQLGSAYAALGQPQRAIAYMDSAVSVARAHGLVREESEDLQIYAELLGDAGDHQAALRHLDRAKLLADSAGLVSRKGDISRAQARELAAISRADIALSRALEAAAIHRDAGSPFEELKDHLLVAEIAQKSRRPAIALRELALAQRMAESLAVPIATENLALGTARVADIAQDPARVLRALPADLAFPRMGPKAAGESQALRARAFARLGQWLEAVGAGQHAVASLNMVREALGEGPLRSAYTSENSDVYADLVVALLHLGRTGEAFEVADAARGHALLEHLNVLRSSLRSTSRDLAVANQLLRQIDYLTERLRSADTMRSPDRAGGLRKDERDLTTRLAAARSEYEDRMRTVARTDPRRAGLLGVSRISVRDVQKSLRPGETLLEYFATPARLFIFVATHDTIAAISRAIVLDDLANAVRLGSELSSKSRNAAEGKEVMRRLYDLLIAPVGKLTALRQSTTLLVIPHSALTYLPFAALIDEKGHRMIESRAVLTLPSASALPQLRRGLMYEAGQGNAVFAPFPDELLGSREEAIAVKRETRRTTSFIGARATESQLRAIFARGGNVHIASHAMLNQTNPMFSHIELAAGKKGNPEDDGSLDVHELLRIPVKSKLVYLSGCETGVGAAWSTSFRRNQDYATLSQAILYAGAQNVVATLWRIDDIGASVFAQRFYAALADHDAMDALAIAQRAMIRDPRYSAPRYWAGYTISGAGISRRDSQDVQRASVQ